jgi:hypothetical protein
MSFEFFLGKCTIHCSSMRRLKGESRADFGKLIRRPEKLVEKESHIISVLIYFLVKQHQTFDFGEL